MEACRGVIEGSAKIFMITAMEFEKASTNFCDRSLCGTPRI